MTLWRWGGHQGALDLVRLQVQVHSTAHAEEAGSGAERSPGNGKRLNTVASPLEKVWHAAMQLPHSEPHPTAGRCSDARSRASDATIPCAASRD